MTDILRHIENPDPEILRRKEEARARSGAVVTNGCPHPMSAVEQFVDDDPGTSRNARPTNLFLCGVCRNFLRLVDFNGTEAKDG